MIADLTAILHATFTYILFPIYFVLVSALRDFRLAASRMGRRRGCRPVHDSPSYPGAFASCVHRDKNGVMCGCVELNWSTESGLSFCRFCTKFLRKEQFLLLP